MKVSPGQAGFEGAPPAPPNRQFAKIFPPADFRPAGYFITGEKVIGCFTHWVEGREHPHAGRKCLHCAEGRGIRWRGYVSAFSVTQGINGILPLTEYAAGQLLFLPRATSSLRGLAITLTRGGKKKTSRVLVRRFDAEFPGVLPPAIDPVPILYRLWRVKTDWSSYIPGAAFDPVNDLVEIEEVIVDPFNRKGGRRHG